MGSITATKKTDIATGKAVTTYRAFIRRTVNGKPVSKSKVFATKTEAKDWLRENESTVALAALGTAAGPTFGDLLDSFVKAPPTKGTRFWNAAHIDFWRAELGAMKTGEINRGAINACKAKLLVKPGVRYTHSGPVEMYKPLTPATVNRYLATLSSVLNFALQRDIIDVHPMKGGAVAKEKESEGRRRILTPDEEQRLYDACEASTWQMMRLLLRVCLTTAARKSEVLNLRWQDIDFDRSVAMLPKTKNDSSRALPLVSDVKAALIEAKKVRPLSSDYVFFDPRHPERPKNINMLWKAARKRAGLWQDRDDPLDQVVLHTTRHTVATKLIRVEKNIAKVQNITGHKTLAMLNRYTHLDTDDAVELAERTLGQAT
jgi:integrase